jgi:hypothetical protein
MSGRLGVLNQKGFSLVEFLIVTCLGLFILGAAFMLQAGSVKLFKDVKVTTDDLQAKMPTMELIARYFDRWGVGVYALTGGGDCSSYPPSNAKCIARTTGTSFDEVTFWGSLYGTGCVGTVASGTANLFSCRLNRSSTQNCYYVWKNNEMVNDKTGSAPIPLMLNANLSTDSADCSALSASNASVSSTMQPFTGTATKSLEAGEIISRAPHRIRLYVAANANDGGKNWLYSDISDTSACALSQTAVPVAPVDGFRVTLLPSGCDAASGGCTSAQVSVTFRSQSTKYDRSTADYQVVRVFGR